MGKKNFFQNEQPFDVYPFEGFYNGSWCNVEQLSIKDGKITTHYEDHGTITEEKLPVSGLRIRSRKANMFDCLYFLRTGVHVCVLLSDPNEDDNAFRYTPQQTWVDAKIESIESMPHKIGCNCRFYVSLLDVYLPSPRKKKMVTDEIRELSIDKIKVLQQLDKKPSENAHFRWISSRDCLWVTEARLFRGQFMHDILWLLVASALRSVEFVISSAQNKILYQVLDGDPILGYLESGKIVKAIKFKIEDGISKPIITTFVLEVPIETIKKKSIDFTEDALGTFSLNDSMCLRRSKRQKVQPDFFVGEGGFLNAKSHVTRTKTESARKTEDVDSSYINEYESDSDCVILSNWLKERKKRFRDSTECKTTLDNPVTCGRSAYSNFIVKNSNNWTGTTTAFKRAKDEHWVDKNTDKKVKHSVCVPTLRNSTMKVKNHKNPEAITTCKRVKGEKDMCGEVQESNYFSKKDDKWNESFVSSYSTSIPIHADTARVKHGHVSNQKKNVTIKSSMKVENSSKRNPPTKPSTKLSEKVKKICSEKRYKERCSFRSKNVCIGAKTYSSISLTQNESKEIIERCMKKINLEISKHQHSAVQQWEEILSCKWWKLPQTPASDDPVERPELEDLWKEMEMSMHSLQFCEENPCAIVEDQKACQHEYVLDEEIGTICRCCRSVGTEIRHILPSFLNSTGRMRVTEYDHARVEGGHGGSFDWEFMDKPSSKRDSTVLDENESVWSLIPNLRDKLHTHQKNAYEFLWKNISGSLMPADMDASSKRTGGCVIAHSPGAGKTLLMISFLESYIKLFPGGRPLILAPKTTLHAWYKEFKKWEVSVPVYQIYARKYYKNYVPHKKVGEFPGKTKMSQNILHTLDCLEKFEKWHDHASVLLMSYPTFGSITKRSSVSEYSGYLANILTESPGLLILDEGHNPRSTRSLLRRSLMKVKTEHRILLSGTLFQNSFDEYFNTLSLARPVFISEVLRALDPASRRFRYKAGCIYKEKRARKIFLEEVANRINSEVHEEKRKGLNLLKRITSGFVDIYEGASSEKLPGLENYMLLVKPTMMQQELLGTVQTNGSFHRYPLDVEQLITLAAIHPWLISTRKYSGTYFSQKKLEELERYKLDLTKGSKVKFIVSLVNRCLAKREKVLIFSHYKDPIWLFIEIFEHIFGWTKGNQVLELHGTQDFSERSGVIDKFEEPGGSAQVLIASISACGEGISLTGASRVVFLDSEWNPFKIKQAIARAYRPGQERVVYVYQLLASGTMEEDKYRKNTWKENVSRMISVGEGTEDASCMKPEDIDDEVMREIVEGDNGQSIKMVMKYENLFGRSDGDREAALLGPALLTFR
ncbi:SNF2 domain-containing protein CLASSY [Ranunculus cassubicifolius]